ncbi:MAG: hypothetical protein JETT_1668 [Candidatus Jettenia ecosi]|uniref:Uncharacterized protein n=1 Tax=Candidatus Jettenia ecosi TaxID=2494326 RepID=A0A533QND4_9BACT|nr:MAG: hypothetical protein JETT_1668 [Candidatus Jettenia ecosi]
MENNKPPVIPLDPSLKTYPYPHLQNTMKRCLAGGVSPEIFILCKPISGWR